VESGLKRYSASERAYFRSCVRQWSDHFHQSFADLADALADDIKQRAEIVRDLSTAMARGFVHAVVD